MSAMPPTPPTPPAGPLSCDEARDLAPSFVLGALDPAEAAAVREHLAGCEQPHPEFAELGGVVPYLAAALEPVAPPETLRARILAAVAADAGGQGHEAVAARAPETVAARAPETVPATMAPVAVETGPRPAPASIGAARARRRSPLAWVAAIAAILVIAGLGAWNLQLRAAGESNQAYQAAVERALAVATSPGGQAAILAPAVPGGPSGLAGIGADGSISVAMHDLAPTSGTAVYEAWVIGPDQKPAAIGSFVVDASGLGALADARGPVGPGVVIALTHEPRAGMTTPTPPVLASGTATGPTGG